MTKEEIRQAAQKESAYQIEIGSKAPLSVQEGFIKGVEWMQERMIEKAVEWLDNNVDKYCFNSGGKFEYIPKVGRKMLEDFKQAMEE